MNNNPRLTPIPTGRTIYFGRRFLTAEETRNVRQRIENPDIQARVNERIRQQQIGNRIILNPPILNPPRIPQPF